MMFEENTGVAAAATGLVLLLDGLTRAFDDQFGEKWPILCHEGV